MFEYFKTSNTGLKIFKKREKDVKLMNRKKSG